jgi:enolase
MIVPFGAPSFGEALRDGAETFKHLRLCYLSAAMVRRSATKVDLHHN